MGSQNCAQCGKALPQNSKGDLCNRCLNRERDFAFFRNSQWPRSRIETFSIAPHLPRLLILGTAKTATVVLLAGLCAFLGAAVVGGVLGISLGFAIGLVASAAATRGFSVFPKSFAFEPLTRRLKNVFLTGALAAAFLSLAVVVAQAAPLLKSDDQPNPSAVLIAAVFLSIIAGVGGTVLTALSMPFIRKRILKNYDAWAEKTAADRNTHR